MKRAGYTGAHAARPAPKTPAEKAPKRKPGPWKKPTAPSATPHPETSASFSAVRMNPAESGTIGQIRTAKVLRGPHRLTRRMVFFLAAIAAALLLAAVAILVTHRPVSEAAYVENMAKAMDCYNRADLDNALRYLRRAASYQETDECLMLMASCYEQENKLDKALELLRMVDASDKRATEQIQQIEQQKTRLKTADTVNVLGLQLPPDTTDLVLDGRNLGNADLAEIVQLYAIDSLSLIDNHISDFAPLAQLGSLDVLNLSGNQVTDLSPLQSMSGLRALYLDGNPLGDLTPLYGLRNLSTLSIQGCGVEGDALEKLAAELPTCAILSDAPDENVSDISLGGLTFRSDVKELDLSSRGIRDISALAACKELRWLNLSGNEISDLQGLMNLPQLGSLDISANQINDLRPLMGLETLRRLKVADNALTDTSALGTMKELQVLDLSGNPIADFSSLRHLTNLTTLKLENTGLTDDDLYYLSGLTMLTQLTLDNNPELGNDAYGRLKSSLPSCAISHTDLVYTILIEDMSVASNVAELDLSGQGISNLSGLDRLNCLEKLNLSRNRIDNLYVFQISASREILRELDLSFNQISSVSELPYLTGLERLNLYGNPLEGVQSLQRMSNLLYLNVGSCGLSAEELEALHEALPNCEIALEVA